MALVKAVWGYKAAEDLFGKASEFQCSMVFKIIRDDLQSARKVICSRTHRYYARGEACQGGNARPEQLINNRFWFPVNGYGSIGTLAAVVMWEGR